MDQLVVEHTYGALWELRVNHQPLHLLTVPVLTLMSLGHTKCPLISIMIISVTLAIVLQLTLLFIITHSGMDRGVDLLARAVPSTPLPGSASLSLNLPVIVWR